ncbi:HK97 family phage prohead protease [Roseicitreum antarcticum]|uniref:Prohead serine protease domain-containing protein n=1 Tax=Roseicitreum antarcticum TaxID=564137 RepID=A0A1H2TXM1_9RHOB|nr:HK97 family phage prohead protease [Roseicitreum antarcticum]SDW48518.1 hypothetical protein SAMN04488238_102210 [Roseicitreum antarcticum]
MTDYSGLEHKFHRPEAGLTVTDGTTIAGYASLFGRPDQGGDVVLPGAYVASLGALRARGGKVRMLWQHDPAQPIGVWDEVSEDARGLFVKGRLLTDVMRGREAVALIGAGALDGLSIGYRTVKAQAIAGGGRRLSVLDLWEVSLVTFPMLSDARVAAKADIAPAMAMGEGGSMAALAQALEAARAALAAR